MLLDLLVTEPVAGVVAITIIGELELSSAPRLREEIIRVSAQTDPPLVVLDLSGIDLLDPTGLGVVFDGVKRTRVRGGDLALVGAEPHVLRDLELLRVTEILPMHDTLDDAVRHLMAGRS